MERSRSFDAILEGKNKRDRGGKTKRAGEDELRIREEILIKWTFSSRLMCLPRLERTVKEISSPFIFLTLCHSCISRLYWFLLRYIEIRRCGSES